MSNVQRQATLNDVAELAGVSIATVSRVVNNSGVVSDHVRSRVLKAIEELNYQPNVIARNLKQSRTGTVGIVIHDSSNPFFSPMVRGAQMHLAKHGWSVFLCNTDMSVEEERGYVEILATRRVDGMIISPVSERSDHFRQLEQVGIPVVYVNRRPRDFQALVVSDNRRGAYMAVAHLIKKGHRRIGLVSGPSNINTGRERTEGYRLALKEFGIPLRVDLMREGVFSQEVGYKETLALLELPNRPTALFIGNNQMTLGALVAIKEKKLRIPEDIAVVGFDETEWAPVISPPLTTVKQPSVEIGVQAADVLVRLMNKETLSERELYLEPELVIRESCGEPLSSVGEKGASAT